MPPALADESPLKVIPPSAVRLPPPPKIFSSTIKFEPLILVLPKIDVAPLIVVAPVMVAVPAIDVFPPTLKFP